MGIHIYEVGIHALLFLYHHLLALLQFCAYAGGRAV
jgi:energy-converting hydrogenase Eha subunit E